MKVCIFGAGAIGAYLAGHLARANCELSVVARGATLAAIRDRGVSVRTPAGSRAARVRATDDTVSLGEQDYLFLTLKAHQLVSSLDMIRPLVGDHTVIIPPTTGLPYYFFHGIGGRHADARLPHVDPGDVQWANLAPAQVLGAVYWVGAHSEGPGASVQDGAVAGIPLGELDGTASPRVQALSALMEAGGIRAPVRDNIRGEIWMKFVNSLCWNPVALLTLGDMGDMGDAADVRAIVSRMMEEADAIGTDLGVTVQRPPESRIERSIAARGHKMSMLQDLEHGRALELEPLIASLEDIVHLSGRSAPTLATVLALARLRARAAERNPSSIR